MRRHHRALRLHQSTMVDKGGIVGAQARELLVGAAQQTPLVEAPDIGALVTALQTAVAAGAMDTAKHLADHALEGIWQASDKQRRDLVSAIIDTRIAWGDRASALELAKAHGSLLGGTRNAVDLLATVLADPLPDPDHLVLADGRLNSYAASKLIEAGMLDVVRLTRLLLGRRALVTQPELNLLLASAHLSTDRPRAVQALNTFLAAFGEPGLALSPSGEGWLGALRAPTQRRAAKGPLVSVVMSTYNSARTVGYALRSLVEQSHQDLEILVGDDGSTDQTPELLAREFGSDPRIRIFRTERNQGPYNMRNALLSHAQGEFLTFQDADDYAVPTRIESQVKALADPLRVACVADWVRVTPGGRFVFFRDLRATRLCLVSLMVRRSAFDEVGPYRRARFGADLEWYDRLRHRMGPDRVVRIPSPLVLGLWSAGSLTRQAGTESLEDGFRSESRRRYSELCFRQRLLGADRVGDTEVDEELARLHNLAEPAKIERIGLGSNSNRLY